MCVVRRNYMGLIGSTFRSYVFYYVGGITFLLIIGVSLMIFHDPIAPFLVTLILTSFVMIGLFLHAYR